MAQKISIKSVVSFACTFVAICISIIALFFVSIHVGDNYIKYVDSHDNYSVHDSHDVHNYGYNSFTENLLKPVSTVLMEINSVVKPIVFDSKSTAFVLLYDSTKSNRTDGNKPTSDLTLSFIP